MAIFSYRSGQFLISETSVPATAPLKSGRIYAEVNGALDTGLAIANANDRPATIAFYFTDTTGKVLGNGSTSIPANQQIAKFLDQAPFNTFGGGTFQGSFSFASDLPVGVIAIRSLVNERQDFLMSTLPVVDTSAPPATGNLVIPHFSDGDGWTTDILLVNPTASAMTGSVEFRDDAGATARVTIAGQANSIFPYSLAAGSSQKLSTAGTGSTTASGSVRILPSGGGAAPTPLVVFSYKPGGVTVTPDRADEGDILGLLDDNLAYRADLGRPNLVIIPSGAAPGRSPQRSRSGQSIPCGYRPRRPRSGC